MNKRLEVKGLTHAFGGLIVASEITFDLEQGSRTALIGPNGAGKTTLVNLISGALKAASGDIILEDRSVWGLGQAARARAGIVRTFQVGRLFRDLSVEDNIRLPALQHARASFRFWSTKHTDQVVDQDIASILAALNLGASAQKQVQTLPYGEQRLVELAIALALKPRVLLLDEPAAGVPQSESGVILEVIGKLPADLSVLLIEHDMDLVFKFANRILVMMNGALLCDGTPAEIAASEQVKQIYFGRGESIANC
jgi:branched-chain amino acid transport system ATP-binding protein